MTADPERKLALARARNVRYRERHGPRINAEKRERNATDPEFHERTSASAARSRAANREERNAYNAAYREADPERVRRQERAHRERRRAADSDALSCLDAFRNAKQHYGDPDFTYEEWSALWYGTCFDCGVTPARGVDHISGQTQNGLNVLNNLQSACRSCNWRKARALASKGDTTW